MTDFHVLTNNQSAATFIKIENPPSSILVRRRVRNENWKVSGDLDCENWQKARVESLQEFVVDFTIEDIEKID